MREIPDDTAHPEMPRKAMFILALGSTMNRIIFCG